MKNCGKRICIFKCDQSFLGNFKKFKFIRKLVRITPESFLSWKFRSMQRNFVFLPTLAREYDWIYVKRLRMRWLQGILHENCARTIKLLQHTENVCFKPLYSRKLPFSFAQQFSKSNKLISQSPLTPSALFGVACQAIKEKMPGPVSFLKQIKCINCKSNSRVVVVENGVFRPPEFMLLSKLSRNWFHLGCLEVIFHPYTRIIATLVLADNLIANSTLS